MIARVIAKFSARLRCRRAWQLFERDDLPESLWWFRSALDTYQPHAPHAEDTATYVNNMGFVHSHLGDLDSALRYYDLALELSEANNSRSANTAARWNNVGSILQDLRRPEQALRHYETALARYRARSGRAAQIEVARSLNNIASVLGELGKAAEALGCLTEAADIVTNVAPRDELLATVLGNIAFRHDAAGDLDEAELFIRRALAVLDSGGSGESSSAAVRHNNLGGVFDARGDKEKALVHYRRAYEIQCRTSPRSDKAAIIVANIALATHELGRADEAVKLLAESIDIAEEVRAHAGGEHDREAVHAVKQSWYTLIQLWLSEAGRADEAFQYSEHAKARVLSDLIARAGRFEPSAADDEELRLQREISAVHVRLIRARAVDGDPAATTALEQMQAGLIDSHGRLAIRTRRAFPLADQALDPVTVDQVRTYLPPNMAMLAYSSTETHLLVWTIHRNGSDLRRTACTDPRLRTLVAQAVAAYGDGRLSDEVTAEAHQALAAIVLPDRIPDNVTDLVIVPDGVLSYLPFELLPSPAGAPLVRGYTISYCPSATVFTQLRPAALTPRSFLGLGDPAFAPYGGDTRLAAATWFGGDLPPLPATRREVTTAAEHFPSKADVLFGTDATEANLVEAARGRDVVHLATHLVLDDERPLFTGLALAPPTAETGDDDLLQAFEMTRLPLAGALVVCSGCRTAIGRISAGEGVIGLSRAFFAAGASSLVLSTWPVRDPLALRFMRLFYDALATGIGPAAALRRAKLALLDSGVHPYADPATWAPFILIGAF